MFCKENFFLAYLPCAFFFFKSLMKTLNTFTAGALQSQISTLLAGFTQPPLSPHSCHIKQNTK